MIVNLPNDQRPLFAGFSGFAGGSSASWDSNGVYSTSPATWNFSADGQDPTTVGSDSGSFLTPFLLGVVATLIARPVLDYAFNTHMRYRASRA